MIIKQNTAIEDVAAVIGFNATACLIQWHGGRNIYIPDKPTPSHPLAGLLGLVALTALCNAFGGQSIWLPAGTERADLVLKKAVAKGVLQGKGSARIAADHGITQRQVQRLRRELEQAGLLPLILQAKPNSHESPSCKPKTCKKS